MPPPVSFLELFRSRLPARGKRAAISLAGGVEQAVRIDESGALFVSITLTVFDASEPASVVDVKEQELRLADLTAHPESRWLAYLEAHLRALPELLDGFGDDVETLMPMDVVGFPEALEDASLVAVDDFVRAFRDAERLAAWRDAREQQQWDDDLASTGLAGRAREVRALEAPSIRLRASRLGDEEAEDTLGTTRIGGAPDLPPSMRWPEIGGEALAFVAQLDLASLAGFPAAAELPATGLLSFFYSQSIAGVQGNPVRVFHIEDVRSLERRPLPKGVERVPEHEVSGESEQMFPPSESPFYEALLPEEAQDQFRRSLVDAGSGASGEVVDPLRGISSLLMQWGDADPERPTHRVLGYASSIQGDPYLDLEVELVRGGYDGWRDDSDEARALRKSARRWRLLLQIDASGDGDLVLNQDGGFFYFWIPQEALAAKDWSQVRGSLQCH